MLCWRFQYISPVLQNYKFSLCVLKTFFSYEVFEEAWTILVKISFSGQPTKACWSPTSQTGGKYWGGETVMSGYPNSRYSDKMLLLNTNSSFEKLTVSFLRCMLRPKRLLYIATLACWETLNWEKLNATSNLGQKALPVDTGTGGRAGSTNVWANLLEINSLQQGIKLSAASF